MRKFIVSVVVALLVLCEASFYVYKTNDVSETYENKETKKINNNMLSMMLETSAGTGEYQKTSASAWPTEGYTFNETLSKCEKGSSLRWDSTKNTVVMKGNISDKCYVYFDKAPDPIKLSDYLKNLYTNQGGNNLYLHDSSLTNGAVDNSYRYAGSSETTNNFVCFGYDSTDGSCPTDYLYRIIGIFDEQVKLIKYDYAKSTLIGTDGDYYNAYSSTSWSIANYNGNNSASEIGIYYWNNNTKTNVWSASRLNTTNLNTNYLNNIGINWSNKIANHTWKVGGNTWSNMGTVLVSTSYKNEITSPAEGTTYGAKIGLMYVSDYGYAAASSAWTTPLYNSSGNDYRLSSVTSVNWMYMGLYEWTIARRSDNSNSAFPVHCDGYVGTNYVNFDGSVYGDRVNSNYNAVRPVFYLNTNVTYLSGNGTKELPFLIN